MRAAPAQVVGQSPLNLLRGGPWIRVEKRLRGHDHPVRAITALRSLLVDESPLQRMWTLNGSQPLKCDDFGSRDRRYRCYARAGRHSVQEHRAGPTLAKPATELWPVEFRVIAQH